VLHSVVRAGATMLKQQHCTLHPTSRQYEDVVEPSLDHGRRAHGRYPLVLVVDDYYPTGTVFLDGDGRELRGEKQRARCSRVGLTRHRL